MKKLNRFIKGYNIFILTIIFTNSVIISAQEMSRSELEQNSINQYKLNDYKDARAGFEKLLSIYPKETAYNYYLGMCYLNLNTSLSKSIKYLRFAASKNYRPDVHYYLALAYFRDYQFDNAEISVLNFINLSKKKDLLTLKPENLLASIKEAREDTYMVRKYNVLGMENIKSDQIGTIYALHIEGKFMPKDVAFMTKADKKANYQEIMYLPANARNGDKLYITSVGKSGRTGKDIFISERLTSMDYSIPIGISEINTKYNEEYPYFNQETQTLYFCSDRPGGDGGYDIYKSAYSPENNKFLPPQRLGFPVNSPMDDFLFVPDKENKTAVFLSNRNCSGDELTAYKIDISRDLSYVFPKTRDELRQLAALDVTVDKNQETPVVIENMSPARKPVVLTGYDLALQQALSKQLECDSLQALIISGKNRLRVENDMDQRRVLLSSITSNQNVLNATQKDADSLFAKAESLNPDSNPPHLTDPANNNIAITDENNFAILNNSPYTNLSPIPYGQNLPKGLVYRIQLGAFSQNLPMNTFGGLTPLSAEKINDRKLVKYYVGYFITSKEARKALDKVKNYGFGDAFIVPFYNNEKITIQAAREIEFGNPIQ